MSLPSSTYLSANMSAVLEIEDERGLKLGCNKIVDSVDIDLKVSDATVDESTHYFDDKPLDYIDDVTSFTPSRNSVDAMNSLNVIDSVGSTPKRPPRHVKLKRPQHSRQNSSLDGVVIVNGDAISNRNSLHRDSIISNDAIIKNYRNRFVSIGVQSITSPPYRLRALPRCPTAPIVEASTPSTSRRGPSVCCTCVGRVLLSQCGLSVALFAWAMLGATAFHYTEGPYEAHQSSQLSSRQNELVVELTDELRQTYKEEPTWQRTIGKYVTKHETLLLKAVSSGYGEGGVAGHIWTFPGCVLFSVSLLTTLGYGAPVPRTTLGRGAAIVFAAIGIPLHLLLVLNVGMLISLRVQRFVSRCHRKASHVTHDAKCRAFDVRLPSAAKWLTWFPIVAVVTYYALGVLAFGVARQRHLESVMFPLDFTVAGGVAKTKGHVRVLYALYLEGAVVLAGTALSLLRASASNRFEDFGLRLGVLTNSQ